VSPVKYELGFYISQKTTFFIVTAVLYSVPLIGVDPKL
jgi:hypothetical protein